MGNGNIKEYLRMKPEASNTALVSSFADPYTTHLFPCQLSDVAEALAYLHSRGIIHGNIKGASESRKVFPNLLTHALDERSHQR